MSKTDVIILRVILVIVIFLLFRTFKPRVELWWKKSARVMRVVFLAAAVVVFVLLGYLAAKTPIIGLGNADSGLLQTEGEAKDKLPADCIIIREDKVWIEGKQAKQEDLEHYINQRVENNITIRIVDDYSSADYFEGIVDLCRQKGAKYEIENESFLETK